MRPGNSAAAVLLRTSLHKLDLDTFMADHASPTRTPGVDEVEIDYREPYAAKSRLYYVPMSDIMRAVSAASKASASGDNTAKTATTSAGVAPGNSERAIASAVIKRSYTKRAARPSSLLPLRSTMRSRASKGSVLVNVVIKRCTVVLHDCAHGNGGSASAEAA